MHTINVHVLGAVMLGLWFAQWVVMARGPGGFPKQQQPEGAIARLYNVINMATLLIVIPGTALMLLTGWVGPLVATGVGWPVGVLRSGVEVAGLVCYVGAHGLMSWARFSIGGSFQMGGVAPRADDRLAVRGAYRVVRHPMYTALLGFDLGLLCLTQSIAFLVLLVVIFALILRLIPVEDRHLAAAYGDSFEVYRNEVRALVPGVY